VAPHVICEAHSSWQLGILDLGNKDLSPGGSPCDQLKGRADGGLFLFFKIQLNIGLLQPTKKKQRCGTETFNPGRNTRREPRMDSGSTRREKKREK
jgi:hypothetical protein